MLTVVVRPAHAHVSQVIHEYLILQNKICNKGGQIVSKKHQEWDMGIASFLGPFTLTILG